MGQEAINLSSATRVALIALFNDERFAYRQAASDELIRRGAAEIKERGLLTWKRELMPTKQMTAEMRLRLQGVMRALTLEEAKLMWKGMIMPQVSGYEPGEVASVREYCTTLNQVIGGTIDIERAMQAQQETDSTMLAGIPGEPFWECIRRNRGNITLWGEEGRLILDTKPEERFLAYDGALCGRLKFDECGATVFLLTNPGVEFLGWRPIAAEAQSENGSVEVELETDLCCPSQVNVLFPTGPDFASLTSLKLKLSTLGAPVARMTVEEFREKRDFALGPFKLSLHPAESSIGAMSGSKRHTILCQMELNPPRNGVFKHSPNRFFTAYGERSGVQYSGKYARSDCFLGGGNFRLSLPEPLTRLDIRVPDFDQMNTMNHTLSFDLKQKRRSGGGER